MKEFLIDQIITLGAENMPKDYAQPLTYGDSLAHRWRVTVQSGGAAADLSGCTATMYFSRQDGKTSLTAGTIAGNRAEAVFPAEAYAAEGAVAFEMVIQSGDATLTQAVLTARVRRRRTDDVIIPGGGEIYDLPALLAQIEAMKSATASATSAAGTANTAAQNANEQTQAAREATQDAQDAAAAAGQSAATANAAAAKIDGMTVSATGLAAGKAPTAAISETGGHKHITFGIPKGDTGDTGATPNLKIGTVTTGQPGTNAAASIRGTAENPIIDFTIPRGNTGSIQDMPFSPDNPEPLGEANPGTSDYVARKDHVHEMPSAQDVGALEKDGTAVNADKLDGKAAKYYLSPLNLLDNSDFTSPVNQRGYSGEITINAYKYFYDRWGAEVGTGSIVLNLDTDSGITIKTTSAAIYQMLEIRKSYVGKKYTFAAEIDDEVICTVATISADTYSSWTRVSEIVLNGEGYSYIYVSCSGSKITVHIGTNATSNDNEIKWAALYEGEYTAETLPPYVPKPYITELTECQRYYQRLIATYMAEGYGYIFSSTKARLNFPLPVKMRILSPTIGYIDDSNNSYTMSESIELVGFGSTSIRPTAITKAEIKESTLCVSFEGSFSSIVNQSVFCRLNHIITLSADL